MKQILIDQHNSSEAEKIIRRAENKVEEIRDILKKYGKKQDWLIADLPKKDIVFVKSERKIVKNTESGNILLERVPVKLSVENGNINLLALVENSIISKLQHQKNYLPNVFCSGGAYQILLEKVVIESTSAN